MAFNRITSSTVHFDYPYTRIYQLIVEYFVVEIHHGHFHFFVNGFSFNFWVQTWFQSCAPEVPKILVFLCVNQTLTEEQR